MSYDVSFKAKLDGIDQYVSVGDDWINHTSNTADMIEAVCNGTWPSKWDNMKCNELLPILQNGIKLLKENPDAYRKYEPDNKWGTVESTLTFLERIEKNCRDYSTAIVSVDY